jgi:tetratricopeptide (TPR) repeat protein
MRRHLLAICSLGLLCVPQALADATPHWLQVHTEHFTVITDSNEKDARHIAGQFERMQAVFSKLIPTAHADIGSPIVVLALKDKRGFDALEPPDYLGKGKLDLAGYFMPAADKSYILLRLDAGGQHPFATVYHEYTHYIMRHDTFIPLWLNEGLAEFYQNTDIDEKDVRFGQPSPDDILFLRHQRLLPLTTLLAVDRNSPYYHEEQKGSIFYSQSWALTHFIVFNDRIHHTHLLDDYIRNLAAHQDAVTAAQNAFGDLTKLQAQLERYVNFGDYRLLTLPMSFTVNEAAFRVDSLATPDADAIRADILVDTQRTQEAQALLDAVLRSNPDNAQAHESEGALYFREHDIAAARKWYGEAIALHSTSYLAFYYYAAMSLQLGDADEAAVEASLQHSLQLNPGFAPANDTLAAVYARHHKNLDRALELSILAIEAEPDNLDYRLNNAQIHMERDEIPSALSVLAAARQVAKSPGQLVEIDIRAEQIQHYKEQLDQLDRLQKQAAAEKAAAASAASTSADSSDGDNIFVRPTEADEPHYPDIPPTGPPHTVKGTLHHVHCAYPSVLTLTVDGAGPAVTLYTNNMYKITYRTANFTTTKDLTPCTTFDGVKASVTYTAVDDKRVAGQILSITLSK